MTGYTKRSFRRPAGLVVALAMALSLPGGLVEASHNSCTTQGSSDPNAAPNPDWCPEFRPGFDIKVLYPYRNTPATLNLEVSQAPHKSNILKWESFLPAEWQFHLGIRPAKPAVVPPVGDPDPDATSCGQIFNGSNNAPRAEAVSDGNQMWTHQGSSIAKWTSKRGLYYLNTVGSLTTLCARFVSGGNTWTFPVLLERIAQDPGSLYGWKMTVDVEDLYAQSWWVAAAGAGNDYSLVLLDIEFGRRTSGIWHEENGTPWPQVFSRAPRDPLQTRIGSRAWTCTNGQQTVAACTDPNNQGFLLSYPLPKDTTETPPLFEKGFTVNLPPALPPQGWAKFTRAGQLQMPGTGVGARLDRRTDGFGYADGTTDLPMQWNHQTGGLAQGVEAVGYALAVRKITPHQFATPDEEEAAGRVMYKRVMGTATGARTASFDLTALPENIAQGAADGKYDVSIATIYNATIGNDTYLGYRSDGKCDGVLTNQLVYDADTDTEFADDGRGVLCPAGRPSWLASGPGFERGFGTYQVLVREHAWPIRYSHNVPATQPFQVLLVDPEIKRAEFVVWGNPVWGTNARIQLCEAFGSSTYCAPTIEVGPTLNDNTPFSSQPVWGHMWSGGRTDQGPSYSWESYDLNIYQTTGPAPGIVQFGRVDLEGESHGWWFAGRIGGPSVATPSRWNLNAGAVAGEAYGIFEQYAPRGSDLDWFRPGGWPTPQNFPTWLNDLTSQRGDDTRMYPETVTSEFIGRAF